MSSPVQRSGIGAFVLLFLSPVTAAGAENKVLRDALSRGGKPKLKLLNRNCRSQVLTWVKKTKKLMAQILPFLVLPSDNFALTKSLGCMA